MAIAKASKSRVRVNVIFEAADHERLAAYCDETGHKKSTLIARVVREYLDRHAAKAAKVAKPTKPAKRRPKAPQSPARSRRAKRHKG